MKTLMRTWVVAAVIAGVALQVRADGWIESRAQMNDLLGSGGTCEDFEGFEVPDNQIAVTDCRAVNCTRVCNGQGPGLVECDNSYAGFSNNIIWLGRGHEGHPSRCIRSDTSLAITYPTRAQVAGFELREERRDTGIFVRVRILDADGFTVDSREFQDASAESVFVGYQFTEGIAEIRLEGLFSSFPTIDDHCFGAEADPCPEGAKIKGAYRDGDDIKIKLKDYAPNETYLVQVIDVFGGVVSELAVTVNSDGKAVITLFDFNCDFARHRVRNDDCGEEKAVKKDCTG